MLGNFKTKAGVNYSYTNGHPHQASSIGSQNYTYDSNGNLTSDGVRSYTWNTDNQPTVISDTTYTYNSDNERVTSYQPSHVTGTAVSPITYLEGMREESSITQTTPSSIITQSSRLLYQFGGQVIAERSLVSLSS